MDPNEIARERSYNSPYADSPWLPLLLITLATQKHAPKTKSQFEDEYDYIIVGAGSAGSVVASRLSELFCINVLLLEAGPSPPRITDLPAVPSDSFINTDIDWGFSSVPQKYTAAGMKGTIPFQSGKTLGGGSALNGMVYSRGNRRNYDEWERLGAKGWGYDSVLPYFKKLEDNTDSRYLLNGYHAIGGPITVSTSRYTNVKKQACVEVAKSLGFQFVDVNAREQIGFYDYQQNTRKGQRCSTAKGYLVPSENRSNLDIVINAFVKKVIIKNEVAFGVEIDYKNQTRVVRARREVILSAGALNTPKLLMLSGVGPMSELKKHKIPLVADLPVGLNFQDHPLTLITYEVDNRLPKYSDLVLKDSSIKEYLDHRTGVLTPTGVFMQAYLSSSDNRDTNGVPDYCIYLGDIYDHILPPGYPTANKSFIGCASQLLHPYSRGTIALKSADPYDPPLLDPCFLSDPRDVYDIVEGLKTCERLMKTPAMKRIGAKPLNYVDPNCKEFFGKKDLYLRCIVRTYTFTTLHVAGVARMGDPRDPRTVVDPQLRVKGVRNLRVVDASVMPTVPWSNTNIPTIMVGEKGSDIVKSTIRCNAPSFFQGPVFRAFG